MNAGHDVESYPQEVVMSDEFYLCETCRQKIDIDAEDTIKARRLMPAPAMGDEQTEYVEGEGLLFHRGCYRDSPRWRRV